MSEEGFLSAILDAPKDDANLLIYSDWLEERGDPMSAAKAEFLRLTVAISSDPKRQKKKRRTRIQELAASLDTDWLAAVSRLPIEYCKVKRTEGEVRGRGTVRFEFLCERKWEDLQATDARAERLCAACRQKVYYCDTIGEARRHAGEGHCIAVDLGVIRREGDLNTPRMYMGRASPETLARERELSLADPVSAERERRKQEAREESKGK